MSNLDTLQRAVADAAAAYADARRQNVSTRNEENKLLDAVGKLLGKKLKIDPTGAAEPQRNG
jgi:hypothetical protein